jgi:hypothetical protein
MVFECHYSAANNNDNNDNNNDTANNYSTGRRYRLRRW